MEKLSYKLEVFEGPMDLLLHLISKHKLNIYDIPVAELLEQYLAHTDAMREADMDVQSEFLEMASRLLYIKTVSLLPKHDEIEKKLLLACDRYNIPYATNIAAAEVIIMALDRGDLDWRELVNPKSAYNRK